jgi:hypothetical protein
MDEITISQILSWIATITAFWVFAEKIIKAYERSLDEKLNPMKEDISMLNDVCYQMLDHMATNNNTGGMKKALDQYNAYQRKH